MIGINQLNRKYRGIQRNMRRDPRKTSVISSLDRLSGSVYKLYNTIKPNPVEVRRSARYYKAAALGKKSLENQKRVRTLVKTAKIGAPIAVGTGVVAAIAKNRKKRVKEARIPSSLMTFGRNFKRDARQTVKDIRHPISRTVGVFRGAGATRKALASDLSASYSDTAKTVYPKMIERKVAHRKKRLVQLHNAQIGRALHGAETAGAVGISGIVGVSGARKQRKTTKSQV